MTRVIIRPYNSRTFPVEAVIKKVHYSNVYETIEQAKFAMTSRFGPCSFVIKQ